MASLGTVSDQFLDFELQRFITARYAFEPDQAVIAVKNVRAFIAIPHPSGFWTSELTQALYTHKQGNFRYFVSKDPNFDPETAAKEIYDLFHLPPVEQRIALSDPIVWKGLENSNPSKSVAAIPESIKQSNIFKLLPTNENLPLVMAGIVGINEDKARHLLGYLLGNPYEPMAEYFKRFKTEDFILKNISNEKVQRFLEAIRVYLMKKGETGIEEMYSTERTNAQMQLQAVISEMRSQTVMRPQITETIRIGSIQATQQTQGMPLWQKLAIGGGIIATGLAIYFWDDIGSCLKKIEQGYSY